MLFLKFARAAAQPFLSRAVGFTLIFSWQQQSQIGQVVIVSQTPFNFIIVEASFRKLVISKCACREDMVFVIIRPNPLRFIIKQTQCEKRFWLVVGQSDDFLEFGTREV